MASRSVGRLTKSIFSKSVLPRAVLGQKLSLNSSASSRDRIWSCSKETDRSQIGLECLKDMVIDGDLQLFDVREPHELVSLGKIPKSVNIPCERNIGVFSTQMRIRLKAQKMTEIVEAFSMSPSDFEKKYGVRKPDVKDENLIFHCQTGRRAGKAVESVKGLGFEKASRLVGGWSELDFHIKRKPHSTPREITFER